MSIKLVSLKSNSKREEEGDWVPAPPNANMPGVRFRVRGATASWRMKSDQLTKRLQRKHGDNTPPEIEALEWGQLICSELLRGWDGIDEPYSPEVALNALTNADHRALRVTVMSCAYTLSAPDVEFTDDAAKKSAVPSAMSSNGEAQTTSSKI